MTYKLPEGMRSLKGRGDPYSDAVIAKIKGSASNKRKLAQKISSIKRMNPDKMEKELLNIVRNPEASALQIQGVINEVLKDDTINTKTKIELIGKMVQAHTAIHGVQTKNLNVNANITSDAVIERLMNWKKQGEGKTNE